MYCEPLAATALILPEAIVKAFWSFWGVARPSTLKLVILASLTTVPFGLSRSSTLVSAPVLTVAPIGMASPSITDPVA